MLRHGFLFVYRVGLRYRSMKITLNIQLDKEVYLAFHDAVVGGADFGKKIRDEHPTITPENYSEYIDNFYTEHEHELEEIRTDTESCFLDVKDILFSELKNYFGRDYSNENYVCALSIFDCNPRYLETKTFQVYYKRSHEMRKEVIVHELTHFAFFSFCSESGIKDSQELWELSEIFNVLFLNIPAIQKVIGAEELLFYPDLKSKLDGITHLWEQQLEAKQFITSSLQYLQHPS